MTSRSEHGRIIRGLAANLIANGRPADSAALRDALVNNASHLLDQRGQTLAAMSGTWTTHDDEDATEWHMPFGLPDVVAPVTLLSSGDTARVVVHLRARASTTGTVALRVQLMTMRGQPVAEVSNLCAEVSTSSTATVSLTPDPIYVSADDLGDYARETPAPLSRWRTSLYEHPTLDADGDVERIRTLLVRLRVWARTTSGAALPVVHAVTAREYIGG